MPKRTPFGLDPKDPVKLYMCATGPVTQHLAPNLEKATRDGHLTIAGVFEPNDANYAKFIESVGQEAERYETYEGMLDTIAASDKSDKSKLVGIFSPPRFHGEQARQAAERGISTCVMKPLASSYDEGSHIVGLAKEHNAVLHCAPTHPELIPAYQMVRKWVEDGRLGKLLSGGSNAVFAGHETIPGRDGSVWYGEDLPILGDLAPYPISAIGAFLGQPQQLIVQPQRSRPKRMQNGVEFSVSGPDYFAVTWLYKNPTDPLNSPTAFMEVGYVPPGPGDWSTTLRGSEGMSVVRTEGHGQYSAQLYDRMGILLEEFKDGTLGSEWDQHEDAHVMAEVLYASREVQKLARTGEPVVNRSADAALLTLRVIDSMRHAYNNKSYEPVEV
jgi:predicted dehydrogenase